MYRFLSNSFVDSPDGNACIIFSKGCNISCKYCYNTELRNFEKEKEDLTPEQTLEKLINIRKKSIDGKEYNSVDWLIISGGEPLYANIDELIFFTLKAKEIGLKTGIYTTGLFYEKFMKIFPYLDFIHIDYKYNSVLRDLFDLDSKTEKVIKAVLTNMINQQVWINTTLLRTVHTPEVLLKMKEKINYDIPFVLNKGQKIFGNINWLLTPVSKDIRNTLVPIKYEDYFTEKELNELIEKLI